MLTTTSELTTKGAHMLRPNPSQAVDGWIAAAHARIALDQHADVSAELYCAAFEAELEEAGSEVTS